MLVLYRKPEQVVCIEGLGTVRVVRCSEHGVRLGFDFPRSINIYREELHQGENPEAEGTPVDVLP